MEAQAAVLGWNLEASSDGVIPAFLPTLPSPCWGPSVLSSSLCLSWVSDMLVAEEKSIGSKACLGLGDSPVG